MHQVRHLSLIFLGMAKYLGCNWQTEQARVGGGFGGGGADLLRRSIPRLGSESPIEHAPIEIKNLFFNLSLAVVTLHHIYLLVCLMS